MLFHLPQDGQLKNQGHQGLQKHFRLKTKLLIMLLNLVKMKKLNYIFINKMV